MSVMTSVIPHGRPFTVDDLEGMPDDGNRYELIDGMLHVSPCPVPRHQVVLGELFFLLRLVCPSGLLAMVAPMDVQPDRVTSLQPDVLVTRPADFSPKNLPVAAAARGRGAVAVDAALRPQHQTLRVREDGRGVVLDRRPDRIGCAHGVRAGRAGRYQQVAHVEGDEPFVATRPFPVTVVPARLLDGLRPR